MISFWPPKWSQKWCHFDLQNHLKNDVILTSKMTSKVISFWPPKWPQKWHHFDLQKWSQEWCQFDLQNDLMWSPKWSQKWYHADLQNNLKNDIILTSQNVFRNDIILISSSGSVPIGDCELQRLSEILKEFQKTEGIWTSSGAHTTKCVHFLELYHISLSPVSCHFKEQFPLDRIGSNWRLRAPDTLVNFQSISKNRGNLDLIWSSYDEMCQLFGALAHQPSSCFIPF